MGKNKNESDVKKQNKNDDNKTVKQTIQMNQKNKSEQMNLDTKGQNQINDSKKLNEMSQKNVKKMEKKKLEQERLLERQKMFEISSSSSDKDDDFQKNNEPANINQVDVTKDQIKRERRDDQNKKKYEYEMKVHLMRMELDSIENFVISMEGQKKASKNQRDIIIENFCISAYKKKLFNKARLQIMSKRRYGLVGPNGTGKSTILLLLEARKFEIPENMDIHLVQQEVKVSELTAVDIILSNNTKMQNYKNELQELENILEKMELDELLESNSNNSKFDEINSRVIFLSEELEIMGYRNAEYNVRSILHGLGFDQRMQNMPSKMLSGGQRERISLAAALFQKPDLLLLDEPTNHLDLNAVIWLEDYLQKWPKSLVVTSHDIDFLSNITTDVIEIEDQKLIQYNCGYGDYELQRFNRIEKKKIDFTKQQKELRKMIQNDHMSKEKASQQMLDKLQTDELIQQKKEYQVNFRFPDPDDLFATVVKIDGVSFSYNQKYCIFKDINLELKKYSRIALVGNNGTGKSTFLKLMTGQIQPDAGDIIQKDFSRIGVYNQHFQENMDESMSPIQYLQNQIGNLKKEAAHEVLGQFGLSGEAHNLLIKNLSGGQKARVVFAYLAILKPDMLVLDEPTNHLDSQSVQALAEGLRQFKGGLILVTHDAKLLKNTECDLWVCGIPKYGISHYKQGFNHYKKSMISQINDFK